MTKVHLIIYLLLSTSQFTAFCQVAIYPNLAGEDLIKEVVDDYKPLTVQSYGDARDLMYGEIYNVEDNVSCVYTGHTIFLPPGEDPTGFLYMNGSDDGINAEHTYPRSKGAAKGNGFSDMHHLFPARAEVNSARSNFPFGEIVDTQTSSWFYLDNEQSNVPTSNIDLYSEQITGKFEPQENHKGNVARAVFYFFSMYKDEALAADPDFFESQRQALCDWHQQDPVDELEWDRTYMIASHQLDLPNPFVIDSTLASRAYCGGLPTSTNEAIKNATLIYPNPILDKLYIKSKGVKEVKVLDIFGRVIRTEKFIDEIEIDLDSIQSGSYFILIDGKVFRAFKS